MADGESGIIFSFEVVGESLRDFDDEVSSRMCAVILRLSQQSNLFDNGRVIIADSAFPSLELLDELRKRKTYAVCAIKKKRYWPAGTSQAAEPILTSIEKLEYGEFRAKRGKFRDTDVVVAGRRAEALDSREAIGDQLVALARPGDRITGT
jgi:hypothetical protein